MLRRPQATVSALGQAAETSRRLPKETTLQASTVVRSPASPVGGPRLRHPSLDPDPDGGTLTAVNLVIAAGGGTLVDNNDGTWSYTPAPNDDTSVTFSYSITDGIAPPVATTATLDIAPVNDAPTTTPVVLAPIAEDSGARLITQAELLANASDGDGNVLTAINLSIASEGGGTLRVDLK